MDLPVTTEIALQGGVEVYNYPKYLADISYRETKNYRICTVRDRESQDLIVEFDGRKLETKHPSRPNLDFHNYPEKRDVTFMREWRSIAAKVRRAFFSPMRESASAPIPTRPCTNDCSWAY